MIAKAITCLDYNGTKPCFDRRSSHRDQLYKIVRALFKKSVQLIRVKYNFIKSLTTGLNRVDHLNKLYLTILLINSTKRDRKKLQDLLHV